MRGPAVTIAVNETGAFPAAGAGVQRAHGGASVHFRCESQCVTRLLPRSWRAPLHDERRLGRGAVAVPLHRSQVSLLSRGTRCADDSARRSNTRF